MWQLRVPILLVAASVLAHGVSPCAAESPEEAPRVSFHVGLPVGIRRLRPETWGLVAVTVDNAADEPAEVLATMYFAHDPSLQYARRLWVPARARRYSWCPVLTPPAARPDTWRAFPITTQFELKSLLFDRSGPKEVLLRRRSEPVVNSGILSIHHRRAVTAVISRSSAYDEADEGTALDAIAAARMSAGLSPILSHLYEDFLPPVVESLEGLDQLVLYSDRLASDAAGLAAVRRWLVGGGRLWIMLDRVDPATVELLLGDAFPCHVVDRVGLCEVLIQSVDPESAPFRDEPRRFEEPVDLVRVLATDVEVTYSVNGWPASFWQEVGKGEVLFTTLGLRAWVRPRTARDPRPGWPLRAPRYAATRPLEYLGSRFFRPREPPMLQPEQFEPYLLERIGYRVLGRGSIFGVLGTFCLVLLAGGIWLGRKTRLEQMGWLGPAAAGVAAAALVVMGLAARTNVPPTLAIAQLVEVEPRADAVTITGLVAWYNQQPSHAPVGARRGGIFRLDMTGLAGTTRRMVRTDLDRWHWERLALPAGVRTATFKYTTEIDRPTEARARFGPEGLTGTLHAGPFANPADAILTTPTHRNMAVELDERGSFDVGLDQVLAPGQFVAGTITSDEQRRRQSIYRQLFSGGTERGYPERPTLLVWTRPLDIDFTFPGRTRTVGSALLAVPLGIERTPPETRVVIPWPFLDFRSIRGPLGEPSAAYSRPQREWLEMRRPTDICLRFQLPEQVLPLRLELARLALRINAPSRTLSLFGFAGEKPVALATRHSPVGRFRFEITRSDVLQLDDRGGLLLAVSVDGDLCAEAGMDTVSGAGSAWKIEAIGLEVVGKTL